MMPSRARYLRYLEDGKWTTPSKIVERLGWVPGAASGVAKVLWDMHRSGLVEITRIEAGNQVNILFRRAPASEE